MDNPYGKKPFYQFHSGLAGRYDKAGNSQSDIKHSKENNDPLRENLITG